MSLSDYFLDFCVDYVIATGWEMTNLVSKSECLFWFFLPAKSNSLKIISFELGHPYNTLKVPQISKLKISCHLTPCWNCPPRPPHYWPHCLSNESDISSAFPCWFQNISLETLLCSNQSTGRIKTRVQFRYRCRSLNFVFQNRNFSIFAESVYYCKFDSRVA